MAATAFLNRVYVATATTGTGTLTLGAAAASNMLSAANAGAVDGAVYSYVIEEGGDFELGTGLMGGSGTTLTRTNIIVSKIGGTVGTSKMSLGGAARVRILEAAADFKGFLQTSGSFTPTITFATPGDLSVSYTIHSGHYVRSGRLVAFSLTLITSAFTWSTASGALTLAGLPFNITSGGQGPSMLEWGGINKIGGYTSVNVFPVGGTKTMLFDCCGMGKDVGSIVAGDVPSGGTVRLIVNGTYETDDA